MKSLEAKKKLQRFLFGNRFTMSCTEFSVCSGFWADVFAIQHNGYCCEYEIKVDYKDLKSEIDCIQHLLITPENYHGKFNKIGKHLTYLNSFSSLTKALENQYATIPNKFSFVVSIDVLNELKAKNLTVPEKVVLSLNLTEKEVKLITYTAYDALIDVLTDAGYGLYEVKDTPQDQHYYNDGYVVKLIEPKFLHKVKSVHTITKFAQRCFIENYNNHISKD